MRPFREICAETDFGEMLENVVNRISEAGKPWAYSGGKFKDLKRKDDRIRVQIDVKKSGGVGLGDDLIMRQWPLIGRCNQFHSGGIPLQSFVEPIVVSSISLETEICCTR